MELTTTEARAGSRTRLNWQVLVISTLVAFALLTLIYFLFPWPDSGTEASDQTRPVAPEQAAPEGSQGAPAR